MLSGDPATWTAPDTWPADSRWQLEQMRTLADRLRAVNPAWLIELDAENPEFLQLIVRRQDMEPSEELAALFVHRDVGPNGSYFTIHKFGDEDGASCTLEEAVSIIEADDQKWISRSPDPKNCWKFWK